MDQYSQPQPSFYQSEVAFEKTKNVIFETSPIKLILALVLPGVISGIIKAAQPLIIDWIVGYTDTNYSKWYSILLILNAVLIFALTCIVTFSLCKNKKEGIMILGLNFFVGSVLKIFTDFIAIFQKENGFGVLTIITYAISLLSFVATVLLALYLTKHGEKHAITEPINGYFSTKIEYLIIAAVLITVLEYFLSALILSIFSSRGDWNLISSISKLASDVLILALMLIFCTKAFKNRKDSLLFFGMFSLSSVVMDIFSGFREFLINVVNMPATYVSWISFIAIAVLIAVRVLLLVLMTREKRADTVGTTEPQTE